MTDMAYYGNERSKKRKKEVDDEDLDDIFDPDWALVFDILCKDGEPRSLGGISCSLDDSPGNNDLDDLPPDAPSMAGANRSDHRKGVEVDESAHGRLAGTLLSDDEAWKNDFINLYDSSTGISCPGDHPIRQRIYVKFCLSQVKLFDICWKKVLEEVFPQAPGGVELTTKAFKKECVEKRDGPPSEMYENLDVAISTLVEYFSGTVPLDFLNSIRRFREDIFAKHPDNPKMLRELDNNDHEVLLKGSLLIVILQRMLMSLATKTNKGSANKGVITERVCLEVFKEKHVGGGTKHGKLMLIEELYEWLKRDFPSSPESRGSRR